MIEECHTETLEPVLGFDRDGPAGGSIERARREQGCGPVPGIAEWLFEGRGSRERLEAEQHSDGWISSENLQEPTTPVTVIYSTQINTTVSFNSVWKQAVGMVRSHLLAWQGSPPGRTPHRRPQARQVERPPASAVPQNWSWWSQLPAVWPSWLPSQQPSETSLLLCFLSAWQVQLMVSGKEHQVFFKNVDYELWHTAKP